MVITSPKTPTPRRRWLQFSLRTLLITVTLAAVALGWWQHRGHCLTRVEGHERQGNTCLASTIHSWADSWDGDIDKAKSEQDANYLRLKKHHDQLAGAYRLAVWQPWLRLWIDEAPPAPLADLEASLSWSRH
jgi:hypothetical protein